MLKRRKVPFLSILMLFAFLVTSCGGAGAESDTIATSVAMTVAAQETERAEATNTPRPTVAAPTSTPNATGAATQTTPVTTFAPPTAPGSAGSVQHCQVVANLVGETIPDGTIFQPGESFRKTWRLKNNGTCTWNSAYKIVYWSGDLMGAAMEYPLPVTVAPGAEVEIPLSLVAPASNGNYASYWKLQSEWGTAFGVGQYDQPFYVQINVNDSDKPDFAVTNLTYNIVREPALGCHTNQWYTVYATITTNGPAEVDYQWLQKDGNDTGIKTLKFTKADSITISREWKLHRSDSQGEKWMQIIIHSPNYFEYPKATWVFDCQ